MTDRTCANLFPLSYSYLSYKWAKIKMIVELLWCVLLEFGYLASPYLFDAMYKKFYRIVTTYKLIADSSKNKRILCSYQTSLPCSTTLTCSCESGSISNENLSFIQYVYIALMSIIPLWPTFLCKETVWCI